MDTSGDSKMKEIAMRVVRMSEQEVFALIYRAAESFEPCSKMSNDFFKIKEHADAGAANWLCYLCRKVLTDFEFALETKTYPFCSNTYTVCGRIRRSQDDKYFPSAPASPPSQTLIALKERVAGITLPMLEREMDDFLQTADFSSGRAMFRDDLSMGKARCIKWLINHKFGSDDVHSDYASVALMSNRYQLFVEIGRSEGNFFSSQ